MNTQSKINSWVFLALFLLAACGGGGGGSSTVPPVNDPPSTGGITGTGTAFAAGPISGFGSVIVNGVRYDTSTAMISRDGVSVIQDDLAVGLQVLIKGSVDDDGVNGVAESVKFEDNVEGPVSSVDDVSGSLVVLGQTVFIGTETSIDDSCPLTLSDLVGVPAVEVSGQVNANQAVVATRIECKAVLGEMEVTGRVSSLDTGTMRFQINALVVDYSEAALDNFPGGTITAEDLVEAKGVSLSASGELQATRVEYKGSLFESNAGDHFEVEGFITRFVSTSDFDVGTTTVTTDGQTLFEGGVAADLELNLKVEVEGEFNSAGGLVATRVEIKQANVVRVTGLVDAVSGDALVILGLTVTTDALLTRFEDKRSDNRIDPLTIGDINVDDYIAVRGQEFPAGSGELAATILERDDARPETELRGFVDSGGVNRPSLLVFGVAVNTDGATVYRDAGNQVISPDDFWTQVADGSLVDVKGVETGTAAILAEELELQAEN